MTNTSMNILALDTCTEMCSAAVVFNGKQYETAEMTQRGHSEKIISMMESVLNDANCALSDIDGIAFGRGPGSFTGVRISVGVAQGVAYAREVPVAPISTLAAVAQLAMEQHQVERVAVAMDARMGEVYAAHFKNNDGIAQLVDKEQVCRPEQFKSFDNNNWFAAGSGWKEFEEVLTLNFRDQLLGLDPTILPKASAIISLVSDKDWTSAELALPVYLRNNVAKKKGEQ